MIEVDGPPSAWFEDANGDKHIYVSAGLRSRHGGTLVQALAQWRLEQEAKHPGQLLVWRERPSYDFDPNMDEWFLYFRYVFVPFEPRCSVPEKREGEQAAYID